MFVVVRRCPPPPKKKKVKKLKSVGVLRTRHLLSNALPGVTPFVNAVTLKGVAGRVVVAEWLHSVHVRALFYRHLYKCFDRVLRIEMEWKASS